LGSILGRKVENKEALAFLHLIFWSIWRERNRRVLEGVGLSLERLKDLVIKTLYFWNVGDFCWSALDVVDLVDSLHIGCIEYVVGCFFGIQPSLYTIHVFPFKKKSY